MAGLATLREVRDNWTIDELADANELLDIEDDAKADVAARARRGR